MRPPAFCLSQITFIQSNYVRYIVARIITSDRKTVERFVSSDVIFLVSIRRSAANANDRISSLSLSPRHPHPGANTGRAALLKNWTDSFPGRMLYPTRFVLSVLCCSLGIDEYVHPTLGNQEHSFGL